MNRPLNRKRTLVTCGSWRIGAAIVRRRTVLQADSGDAQAGHYASRSLGPVWVIAAALRLAGRRLGDTALPIDPQPKQPRPKWSKAEMRIVLTLPPDEALEQLPRRSASVIQTLRCRLRQE